MAPVLRALALTLGMLAVVPPATAAAQARPDAVQQALAEELGAGYQQALPDEVAPQPQTTPQPTGRGGTAPPARRTGRPATPAGGAAAAGLSQLVMLMLWGLAIVMVGVIVALILAAVRGNARNRVAVDQGAPGLGPEPPAPAEPVQVGTGPRLEADALAAEGRYAEAIHCLLLRTLAELAHHRAAPLPPAATSRALLADSRLSAAAQRAFGVLVRATEVTRFGGRRASADHYATCVDHFEAFRRSLAS